MVKKLMREAKKRGIKITLDKSGNPKDIGLKNHMFFLPDDFRKFKGKWMLFIKKGLLVRMEEKKKEEKRKSSY